MTSIQSRKRWLVGLRTLSAAGVVLGCIGASASAAFARDGSAVGAGVDSVTTVKLPRYTADAGLRTVSQDSVPLSGSRYLKSGTDHYRVQASSSTVMDWYKAEMPKFGYVLHSADSANSVLLFTRKSDANFTVEIHFKQRLYGAKDIDVDAYISDLTPPKRPTGSYIPRNVTKVFVRYQPVSTSSPRPWITVTLSDSTRIAALTREINGLQEDIRSNANEQSTLQGGAVLQFKTAAGRTTEVRVDFQKNQVEVNNQVVLFDLQNSVWTTVSKDLGYNPYGG